MQKNSITFLIIVGVFVWGTIHAIGAYRFNNNPLRFLVVMAFVDAFLLFWLLMLSLRKRRLLRESRDRDQ